MRSCSRSPRRGSLRSPRRWRRRCGGCSAIARAKALTDNFFLRWLGAYKVLQARPSTEFFPTFNDQLKRAMLAEISAFCDHLRTRRPAGAGALAGGLHLRECRPGEALRARRGEGRRRSQQVALEAGESSRRHPRDGRDPGLDVAYESHQPDAARASGCSTCLRHSARRRRRPMRGNSKTRRSKKEPKDFREKLAQHASDETCAACHRKMDPLGFGLDNFDGHKRTIMLPPALDGLPALRGPVRRRRAAGQLRRSPRTGAGAPARRRQGRNA